VGTVTDQHEEVKCDPALTERQMCILPIANADDAMWEVKCIN